MKPVRLIAVFFFTISLFACNKVNNQSSGIGDAMIVSKKINNQIKYGISLYAYTFSSFQSVTVTNDNDPTKTYSLEANQGYSTNFLYETPDNGFSTTKPASGTYTFSATFKNGETDVFTDDLTSDVLPLPTITTCKYDTVNHQLQVAWDLISNASSYAINVIDGTNVVFASTELANTVKSYAVSAAGSGWATGFTPQLGKTYDVRVLGFLYEPGGDTYNVQASSVADTTAVWGN